MSCPTCEILAKLETCNKVDAAEHYASLLMADRASKPRWMRINGVLLVRFGEEGLRNIQQAAKKIYQGTLI